jgi:hypothetical protein
VDAYFTIFKFIGSGLVYLFYGMLGLIGAMKRLEE